MALPLSAIVLAPNVPAAAATVDIDYNAFRGWISVTETYKDSWFGDNRGRRVFSSTFVDDSATSMDATWKGEGEYDFAAAPDFCQSVTERISGSGPATGTVLLNQNTESLNHALPVPTTMLAWNLNPVDPTMYGTMERTFCGAPGDTIDYYESGIGSYYGGVPLNADGSLPASGARAYSFETSFAVIDITLCMTTATVDTDGDGLPDGVDVDPGQSGSSGDLGGTPGAAADCPLLGNQPPVAEPDMAATRAKTPVDIPVTANDSDPDGDPVSLSSCTAPTFGSIALSGNLVRYTPPKRGTGTAQFSCTVRDPGGLTDTAPVTVVVGAVLTVQASIDYTTYWYDAFPNVSLTGRPGSDKVIIDGATTATVVGDPAALALIAQVCITPSWKATVSRNVSTTPVDWSEGGRDLMGQDDPFWQSPPPVTDGGFASNLIARAPVCGSGTGVTYAPTGDIVAATNSFGEVVNFTAVSHTAQVVVSFTDGRPPASLMCTESEAAAKKPPAATDLDEFCTVQLQL